MDMQSKKQYLKKVREEYLSFPSRTEKTRILDEAEKRTGLNRKYLIAKLRPKSNLEKHESFRKKRTLKYDNEVRAALAIMWEIFDRPCGERLAPLLSDETERLRKLGELICSDEVASKFKTISPRTIDTKLAHIKEDIGKTGKYKHPANPLLYQKVPVKIFSDQDREASGNIQTDCVEHC